MKVIDAYWEKRNLGVDVIEVSCDASDEPDVVCTELEKITVPYSVVKIPSGCMELLLSAQKCGYSFVETSFEIEGDIRKTAMPKIYERFLPYISIEEASDEMIEKALLEVCRGEIFATDRIALDPMFSKEIAGLRYYNWAQDALRDGAIMEIAYYKGLPTVFMLSKALKDDCNVYDGLIGGVFSEFANKGMGYLVTQCEIDICKKNGGKKCMTRVSSNNLPILRLYLQSGFEIRSLSYTLIKHQ